MRFEGSATAHVIIEIDEEQCPDIITRVLENRDDEGNPQPPGTTGWRDYMYDLQSESEVINMWIANCVANGVEDISQLDGWADLPRGAARMWVDDIEVW